MRNFLAFIRRFRVLLFFALLQGFALAIYFSFSVFPRSQYLTTASNVSGTVLSWRNDLTKHFALSESNKRLQEENIRLREELLQNKLVVNTRDYSDTVDHPSSENMQYFTYTPAMVVKSTFHRRDNYFTLNIGSKEGVKRGMGVISDKGIVGVIHYVSDHFSVVKSCLTKDLNVDVMIEKTGEPGLLKWDGINARRANMTGVSNDTEIKKWSNVVTRGGAGIFPKGLPVGKVEKTTVVEGQPLWDITVKLSENLRSVQYVYVIKNILREEREKIEAKIPEDRIEE